MRMFKISHHVPSSCARAIAVGVLAAFLVSWSFTARAEDTAATRQLLAHAIVSEGDEQLKSIAALAESNSDLVRKVLVAWPQDAVFIYQNGDGTRVPVLLEEAQDAEGKAGALRIDNNQPLTDASGQRLTFAAGELKAADTDNKLRKAIKNTLDLMTLADADPQARRSAVMKLGGTQKVDYLPILQSRQAKEKSPVVLKALQEAIAIIQLKSTDSALRIEAITQLGKLNSIGSLGLLQQIAASTAPGDAKSAAQNAASSIESYISRVNFVGTIFRGLSLGSILLVVALGLAITFGLMGVINMAHGEMIAVGAYTVYIVENIFGPGLWLSPFGLHIHFPALNLGGWQYESYFLVALPLAFLTAAIAGLILERTVIQFLYRRPLESLLATWGVSLILQQTFRLIFGAANVQVNSPRWLSGNYTISDVLLGYNRLFVIGFAVAIVIGTWMILTKTPLGLLIRAVMQNRNMAACMGVRTERVNMLTFAFGSGLAGLAGAFLSQIGNVGPSLGQSYIVDCFMTVVVGGVGNIIGTVCSALGIGLIDQTLQPFIGPVMGKITVLCGIILFLQWRPAGLFVTKSRSLEG
ncbi:MAG: urea transport system permease protein [Chthoniobacter sp.]|jgi:urea transport system permease protein|nr:urea transport system permease protein [Chthoniobacter sp.]